MRSKIILLSIIVLVMGFVALSFHAQAAVTQTTANQSLSQGQNLAGQDNSKACSLAAKEKIPEYYMGRAGYRESVAGNPIERYADQHGCNWGPYPQK